MHGAYYQKNWQMGTAFEARVAAGLGEFALRYQPPRDLVLLGVDGDKILASLVLDLHDPQSGDRGAHLRWFIIDDAARGTGVGSLMLSSALGHLDRYCEGRCWLTTFGGLEAARHLYEKNGFKLTRSETGTRWGYELTDQEFERRPV